MLAGITAFTLLGHQERTHSFDVAGSDALVQGRGVGRADHRVVGMDAVPQQSRRDLARLHFNRLGPASQRLGIVQRGPSADDVFQIHAHFEKFIQQRQTHALLAVKFLAELLIGALRVAGVTLVKAEPEVSTDPLYVREERPNNLLRWDLKVDPTMNGKKAKSIKYDFRLEMDKQMIIGNVLTK